MPVDILNSGHLQHFDVESTHIRTLVMAQPLFDSLNHTESQGLLLTMGLFGWVANPQPGPRKSPLGYLVPCL